MPKLEPWTRVHNLGVYAPESDACTAHPNGLNDGEIFCEHSGFE